MIIIMKKKQKTNTTHEYIIPRTTKVKIDLTIRH